MTKRRPCAHRQSAYVQSLGKEEMSLGKPRTPNETHRARRLSGSKACYWAFENGEKGEAISCMEEGKKALSSKLPRAAVPFN